MGLASWAIPAPVAIHQLLSLRHFAFTLFLSSHLRQMEIVEKITNPSDIALSSKLQLIVIRQRNEFLLFLLAGYRPTVCRNLPAKTPELLEMNKYLQLISAYEAEQRKKMFAYGGDVVSPGSTELATVCYEYSYPDNNSNTNKALYGSKSVSEHHYEQPMVILPSRSPVDSIVKPLISDTSSSSTGGNLRAY